MEIRLNNYDELAKVENFLFRFVYPESFDLQILVTDEVFNYTTEYNDLAKGLVLVTV